jgi:hypothetical protein
MSFEGSSPKYSLRSCWTLGIQFELSTRTTCAQVISIVPKKNKKKREDGKGGKEEKRT